MVEVRRDLWRSSGLMPLLKQGHLEPAGQDHVQTAFEYLQGGRLHNLLWLLVPVFRYPCSKELFPIFRVNFLCFNLCPLPLVLSLGTTEKSLAPSSLHLPFSWDLPKPCLLQAEQPHLSQPFLMWEMIWSLHHPCGPPLNFLQYVYAFLVLSSPELDPALQAWPHQHWAEWQDHLPLPTGNILSNAAQDTICLLCHTGTLLTCVQSGVHQDSQVLLCQSAFQLGGPQYVPVHGVVPVGLCRTSHFPSMNSRRFLSAHFSTLSMSF